MTARRPTRPAAAATEPIFFATLAQWRRWLLKNHATATELLVGFHKRHTSTPCITWPESVDGALAFGWIDGVRRRIDDDTYSIRFTPRKAGSTWSLVNVRRVEALRAAGAMHAAGEAVFARRSEAKTGNYSYEQRPQELPAPYLVKLKKNKAAWAFFSTQAPWYRRTATHWVMSAKKEETRDRRFAQLEADSAQGLRVPPLRPA